MISKRIKLLRTEKGLSQRELAEILLVSQQAVAKWELGNAEPDLKMINTLSEYFNVDVNYLIGNTNIPMPPDKNVRLTADDGLQIWASESGLSEVSQRDVFEYIEMVKKLDEMKKSYAEAYDALKSKLT